MILDEILAAKRIEVAAARQSTPVEALRDRALYHEPRRGFRAALTTARRPAVIAECKRASPSRGVIRAQYDPVAHARSYQTGGATALSILTDAPYFQGALDHLAAARAAVTLPCLRKDFLVDVYQVAEARAWGADCILIIAAACDDRLGAALLAAAAEHGLDALVEVHDPTEMAWAGRLGATLIGVNNRNLSTFRTDLAITEQLAPSLPAGAALVAESGIKTRADVDRMVRAGAQALLVGEAFMERPDPGAALAEWLACPSA